MVGSERRIFSTTGCVRPFKLRSSKVVDFGTNRKGVCDFLIVTLVLSCTVSEIRRLIGWKLRIFLTQLSFNALARGEPCIFQLLLFCGQSFPGSANSAICRKRLCDFLLVIKPWSYFASFLEHGSIVRKSQIFPTPFLFSALTGGEPFRISGSFINLEPWVLVLSVGDDFVIL